MVIKEHNQLNNKILTGPDPEVFLKWNTVRQRFWKNEAYFSNGGYSTPNVGRMRGGLAPQRINPITGRVESMELHHTPPQRDGGLFDVEPVWPDEHGVIDVFRKTGN